MKLVLGSSFTFLKSLFEDDGGDDGEKKKKKKKKKKKGADDLCGKYGVFEREFQSTHFFMFQLPDSNLRNITRIAYAYRKKNT